MIRKIRKIRMENKLVKLSVLIAETLIFQSCMADGQQLGGLADIKPIC